MAAAARQFVPGTAESIVRTPEKAAPKAPGRRRAVRKTGLFGPPRPRVNTNDIAVMTRQLSTMISSGIPLLESMEILEEQTSDPGFKVVLDKVMYAPIWELAFLNGVGPRVAESGLTLIAGHPYSSPYEDVRLKGK